MPVSVEYNLFDWRDNTLNILLVEPNYYTKYPPLGLLKIASYHREKGDHVQLVRGGQWVNRYPDIIYFTSLFTYAWKPVHQAINFYRQWYPKAQLILGGIYASLMPEHAALPGVEVCQGVWDQVENYIPAWDLVPGWKSSVLFSSRGCIRNCPFCGVRIYEPKFVALPSVQHLIYPGHREIICWDNNILASPYWKNIFREFIASGLKIDFNQGLDARLLTAEVAGLLKKMKIRVIRLAYDETVNRNSLARAIRNLRDVGFRSKDVFVYVLYNFQDTPLDFLNRIKDLMEWGVVAYPMRYEPINSLEKGRYVSPGWTAQQLEMVAKARRVIGYAGAWPATEGLKWKFGTARSFEEALALRSPG